MMMCHFCRSMPFSTSDSEVGPSPTKKAKCVAGSDSELSNQ